MAGLESNDFSDFRKIVEKLLLKSDEFDLSVNEINKAGTDIKEGITNLMKGIINLKKSCFLTIKGGGSIAYSSGSNKFEIKLYEGDDEGISGSYDELISIIEKLANNLEVQKNYNINKKELYYAQNTTENINEYLGKLTRKLPTFTNKWNSKWHK